MNPSETPYPTPQPSSEPTDDSSPALSSGQQALSPDEATRVIRGHLVDAIRNILNSFPNPEALAILDPVSENILLQALILIPDFSPPIQLSTELLHRDALGVFITHMQYALPRGSEYKLKDVELVLERIWNFLTKTGHKRYHQKFKCIQAGYDVDVILPRSNILARGYLLPLLHLDDFMPSDALAQERRLEDLFLATPVVKKYMDPSLRDETYRVRLQSLEDRY